MKKNKTNNQLYKSSLNIFFASLFCFILALLFYFRIFPSGQANFSYSWPASFFSARSQIFEFRPGARIDTESSDYLKIISDPVYFSLFSPRNFDQAKVEIKYFDNLKKDTPIIELGILKGGANGNYELQPLENKIIDNLKNSWVKLESDNGLTILQKEKYYTDQGVFWKDYNNNSLKDCSLGINSCVSFYNHSANSDFKLVVDGSIEKEKITQALRGGHRFLIYQDKGGWDLSLSFRDLFLKSKQQDLQVEIYYKDRLLTSKVLEYQREEPSDRPFNNSKRQGKIIGSLDFSGLEENEDGGLYAVVVKADNDIIIEEIESSSNRIVFVNKIWPVYSESSLSLYTNNKTLSLKTFETESLGPVNFANKNYDLDKTYSSLVLKSENSNVMNELELENSGVLIELNGLISLNEETFFNPSPSKLDRFFSEEGGSKYILANYKSPEADNGLKVASASFDLSGVIREEGKYNFVVSVPGLVNHPSYSGDYDKASFLGIKSIEIELVGKSILEKIKESLKL